jgi:hypothetical protein
MVSTVSTLSTEAEPHRRQSMSLMSSMRMTLASVSSLEENCLSTKKTTRVPQRAGGKAEHREEVVL